MRIFAGATSPEVGHFLRPASDTFSAAQLVLAALHDAAREDPFVEEFLREAEMVIIKGGEREREVGEMV